MGIMDGRWWTVDSRRTGFPAGRPRTGNESTNADGRWRTAVGFRACQGKTHQRMWRGHSCIDGSPSDTITAGNDVFAEKCVTPIEIERILYHSFRKFAASRPTPNPVYGAGTPNPAYEAGGLATTLIPNEPKKLRLLSLRAKRSNLLADKGIASPPAAARNDKDGSGGWLLSFSEFPEGKIHYHRTRPLDKLGRIHIIRADLLGTRSCFGGSLTRESASHVRDTKRYVLQSGEPMWREETSAISSLFGLDRDAACG